MTPEATKHIPIEEQELFRLVRSCLDALPDPYLGTKPNGQKVVLSCHILARAVAKVFELDFEDGKFLKVFQHSWVRTKSGHIIDVYPVGMISGPILIDGRTSMLSSQMYLRLRGVGHVEEYGHMMSEGWFVDAVDSLTRTLELISHSAATK